MPKKPTMRYVVGYLPLTPGEIYLQSSKLIFKQKNRELPEEERKSYQAKKLQTLLGASEEQRLENAVDR